jgi:hypothetical protein
MSKYALCLLLIPPHSVFATGWNDYDTELCRGYRLVRTDADNVMIFRDQTGVVITPRLVGLNIYGHVILGEVEKCPRADLASVPGFFILDTETGSVQIGLDEQTWLKTLRAMGVGEPPPLKEPSRFFMWRLLIPKYLKLLWLLLGVSLLLIACKKWRKARKRNKTLNGVHGGGLGPQKVETGHQPQRA